MRTTILALALAASAAGPAAAQQADVPLALPMTAPDDAPAAVADFVAICSAAVADLSGGIAQAQRRGWRMEGEQSALMSALAGFATLTKPVEGVDNAMLSLHRVAFPHAVASNCQMNLIGGDATTQDTAAIGTIPGLQGSVLPLPQARLGRWSGVDADGEVVTLTDTTAGGRFRVLTMARGVLTEAGRAAKAARTDP